MGWQYLLQVAITAIDKGSHGWNGRALSGALGLIAGLVCSNPVGDDLRLGAPETGLGARPSHRLLVVCQHLQGLQGTQAEQVSRQTSRQTDQITGDPICPRTATL